MKAILSLLFFTALLFSIAQAQLSACCCVEGWVLAAPPDINIECLYQHDYFSLQEDEEFTGYGARLDSCAFSSCGVCGGYCDGDNTVTPTPSNLDQYNLQATYTYTPGQCGNTRRITKTFTEFCLGTPFSTTQLVTITDTIRPEVFQPADKEQECVSTDGVAGPEYVTADFDQIFGSARATDLCTNPQWIDYSVAAPTGDTCILSFVRTFTADDECTTPVTRQQTVSFADRTPPVINVEAFFTATCTSAEINTPTIPTFTDACDNVNTLPSVASNKIYPGKCTGDYSIERTWTLTDRCNNAAFATQIIIVEDTTPPTVTPTITEPVEYIEVSCIVPAAPTYTFADACTGPVFFSMEETTSGFIENSQRYDVIRSFKASDDCGNSVAWKIVYNVMLFSVTVFDITNTVPPTIRGADVTLNFAFIGLFCDTAYLVIDIGAANFVSITVLSDCTNSSGGPIYCPITATSYPTFVAFDLTIQIPEDYLPDVLQIRYSVAQSDLTTEITFNNENVYLIPIVSAP